MILDRIVAARRQRRGALPVPALDELRAAAAAAEPVRAFRAALVNGRHAAPRVIAEFKRRSPSAGALAEQADPGEVAASYAFHGAAALSILTEEDFFGGRLDDLGRARVTAPLPILRKDFLLDERDLYEARAAGADAVLLIVRLLDRGLLAELVNAARGLHMDALVEAHSDDELDAALAAGADLIGVNHRDLDTLAIDLSLSERAREQVGPDVVLVAESGLKSAADLERMRARGCDAVLVGESLLRAPSPGRALAELIGGGGDGGAPCS